MQDIEFGGVVAPLQAWVVYVDNSSVGTVKTLSAKPSCRVATNEAPALRLD